MSTRFNQLTIQVAAAETRLMIDTEFWDTNMSASVPVSGSSFAMFARGDMQLNASGFVDPAAASVHLTESDYFTFRRVEGKMLFSRTIAFEEELPLLKHELCSVFRCQRAHVIASSLWAE